MDKKFWFLIIAVLILAIISGLVYFTQNPRQEAYLSSENILSVSQPTIITERNNDEASSNEKVENHAEEVAFSPQRIVNIPGSVQVWYEIPEMGIKLSLSREVAEELFYRYRPPKEVWDGSDSSVITSAVTFSAKHFIEYNKEYCLPNKCSVGIDEIIFALVKVTGIYSGEELRFGSKFLKQFPDFYLITGGSPQAIRFGNEEEEKQFWKKTGVNMPSIPKLQDIYIELLNE